MIATPRGWLTALGAAAVLIAYALLPGTGAWCVNVARGAAVMYANRHSSREARGASLLGEPYRLVRRAAASTPPGCRILIPDGPGHDPISNRVWCLYYLYPRRVLYRSEIKGPLAGAADFLLVHDGWGLDLAGVPPDSIRGTEMGIVDVRTPGNGLPE